MNIVETSIVPLSLIEKNTGQIDGLPANPRLIRDEKFDRLKRSIEENPEMLALRELLVYKHGSKYVIIGGNMRYEALREIGYSEAPCKIIPEDTTVEQLRAYTLKDNSGYGDWNFDLLSSDWSEIEVADANIIPTEWAELPQSEPKGLQKEIQETDHNEPIAVPDILYPSDNTFDIPCLLLDKQPSSGLLMPLQAWGVNTRQKKIIGTYHFYVDDYRFDAIWKDPAKIVASGCQSVIEPNFSLFDTTPVAYGLYMLYKKRWLSRWLQDQGITVWADLNVSKKFSDYNRLGIPNGYNAFSTRGYADRTADLQAEIDIARQISGKHTPNMIVYGGGKEVQRICDTNGLIYCEQYMVQTKSAKSNE